MKQHLEIIYSRKYVLTPTAFSVLQLIATCIDDSNIIRVSIVKLAKILPFSRQSLKKAIVLLEEKGFITTYRENNFIVINWVYFPNSIKGGKHD
ncbi:hypothetical protein HCQ94_05040 [Actinomyces sp. zg-332]|uniref:hypothetical protein n=1 Tax=Actinomyces sp. zg-332 TaxID=2708340 RepID=UPI00141F770B|nr:hypothetical protein [Actinomyces sp. zg-332]QPK93941.1 hypothetical protein HCQ94_05040 [Actinomyces sp. zg-332]